MDGEIDWKARAERAEAACAQKDDALKDCSQFPLGEHLHYKVCAALDDNTCGSGYVRREELDAAKAKLANYGKQIRCIYCNKLYSAEQKDELADHILSCEKSPLVQLNREIQSKATDLMDLTRDEFIRIAAISDNSEIQGICARSQEQIEQKYPVIKQRDEALDKLRLSEAQVVQLLDENNSLKLDYSHAEAESAEARSNVEKCLRELSGILKERDAAKAENARLRPVCEYILNYAGSIITTTLIKMARQALAGKEAK